MLAMVAVSATLDVIEGSNLMQNARVVFDTIRRSLAPHVKSVRGAGCLIGIELSGPASVVQKRLFDTGVLVGSSSDPNVLRLMPPVTTPASAIDEFLSAFHEAVSAAAAA
jgi:4-aminobutyrate aminotransferase-like enzyme